MSELSRHGKMTLQVGKTPSEGSEAAIAGVKMGDVVHSVNGIDTFADVDAMVFAMTKSTRPLLVAFDQSFRLPNRQTFQLSSPPHQREPLQKEAAKEGETDGGDAEVIDLTAADFDPWIAARKRDGARFHGEVFGGGR